MFFLIKAGNVSRKNKYLLAENKYDKMRFSEENTNKRETNTFQ